MYIKNLLTGVSQYRAANRAIIKHKLWPLLAIPGVMSFLYLLFLVIIGFSYLSGFSEYLNENWVPGFMSGSATFGIILMLMWI